MDRKWTESESNTKLAIGMDLHAKNCTVFCSYAISEQNDLSENDLGFLSLQPARACGMKQ